MTLQEFLSRVTLFVSLNEEDRDRLAGMMSQQPLEKGEVLFRKGSEGNALYIVKKGKIKISLPSKDGDEIILTVFSKGDFFGEMALLDGMPRSADAMALEPSQLYVLNRRDFLEFLKNNDQAVESILYSLSMRLRRTDDLLEDTCFLNISHRIAKKLIELAEKFGREENKFVTLDLDFTQTDLAGMIGATRESVNKELRVLRERGVVAINGSQIAILNIDLLKRRIR